MNNGRIQTTAFVARVSSGGGGGGDDGGGGGDGGGCGVSWLVAAVCYIITVSF